MSSRLRLPPGRSSLRLKTKKETFLGKTSSLTPRSELMYGNRSNFAFSQRYIAREWRAVWKLLLKKTSFRFLTRLANRVEHEVSEAVKQKSKARVIKSSRQLKYVLRERWAQDDENENSTEASLHNEAAFHYGTINTFSLSHAKINLIGLDGKVHCTIHNNLSAVNCITRWSII